MTDEKRPAYVPLPPAPERKRRGTDVLSGPDVARVLKILDVPVEQFCKLIGSNPVRVEEHFAGIGDENMPFYYQTALYGLHYCPELRTIDVPLLPHMPFLDPSKTQEPRPHPYRVKSGITGSMILDGLAHLGVPPARFRQLGRIDQSRFKDVLDGKSDGDLPMLYELIFYILDRCPKSRSGSPLATKWAGPLPLPLKEWGIKGTGLED